MYHDRMIRQALSLSVVVAAALVACGCGDLLSLHPLYTEQDRILDPALEGRWENADDRMKVMRDGFAYLVTHEPRSGPSEVQEFEVRLVDLGGVRMADIILTGGQLGHMFIRVRVSDSELRFAFLDSEWLRGRIRHEDVTVARGNTMAVLVARTPALRREVRKYAAVPEAYGEELVYKRASTK